MNSRYPSPGQDKRKRNTEEWAFRSPWLAHAKQAHIEYNESQIHGLHHSDLSENKHYKNKLYKEYAALYILQKIPTHSI